MNNTVNPFAAPQAAVERASEHAWLVGTPKAMRKVKIGLTLVYASTTLGTLAMLGAGILMALTNRDIISLGAVGDITFAILLFAVWGAGVVSVAGHLFCRATPRETGAKWLVDMTLACDASFYLLITASATWFIDVSAAWSNLMSVMYFASIVASFFCFTVFMRRLALFGRHPDIARYASHTLAVGVLAIVLWLTFIYFLYLFERAAIGLVTLQIVSAIYSLVGIAALGMYAYVAYSLRKAITP